MEMAAIRDDFDPADRGTKRKLLALGAIQVATGKRDACKKKEIADLSGYTAERIGQIEKAANAAIMSTLSKN